MVANEILDYCFEKFIERNKQESKSKVNLDLLYCMQKYKYSLPKVFVYEYPINVFLKITSACNLRCKHCFFSDIPEKYNPSDDFNFSEIMQILDFLINDLNIMSILLTGGEPLLNKDFLKIVKYIKTYYIPLIIQTNGTLLNRSIAKKLAQFIYPKTDLIQVSLDGVDKNTHDLIRGDGTFKKAIESIKLLRAYNIPVQINFTLTSTNVDNAINLLNICRELDVYKLSINRFNVCNEKHKYLKPSEEQIFKINYMFYKEMQNYPDIFIKLKTLDFFDFVNNCYGRKLLDNYLTIANNSNTAINKCFSCHNHNKFTIAANGDIFFCSADESEEALLGNLRNSNFYDIWANRFNTPYFQVRDLKTTKCKNCKYISICNTGCMASAFKKYHDINCAAAECKYFNEYIECTNE